MNSCLLYKNLVMKTGYVIYVGNIISYVVITSPNSQYSKKIRLKLKNKRKQFTKYRRDHTLQINTSGSS